jgi:hypothetical protein
LCPNGALFHESALLTNSLSPSSQSEARPGETPDAGLAGFSALAPIDVHLHLYNDDPAFGALLERLNLRVLDVCLMASGCVRRRVSSPEGWEEAPSCFC